MYEHELYVHMKLRELKASGSQSSAHYVPAGKAPRAQRISSVSSELRRAAATFVCRIPGIEGKGLCPQRSEALLGNSRRR